MTRKASADRVEPVIYKCRKPDILFKSYYKVLLLCNQVPVMLVNFHEMLYNLVDGFYTPNNFGLVLHCTPTNVASSSSLGLLSKDCIA